MTGARTPRIPLRLALVALMAGLVLLSVGGVSAVALAARSRSLEATASALARQASSALGERVAATLRAAQDGVTGCVDAGERGQLPIGDPERLAEHLATRVRSDYRYDTLAWMAHDRRSGAGATRRNDGSVLLLWTRPGEEPGAPPEVVAASLRPDGTRRAEPAAGHSFDAFEQVPWFALGASAPGPVWTGRFRRPVDGSWGRMCAQGLREEGRLRGVFGAGFSLAFVADALAAIRIGQSGGVLLLDPDSGTVQAAASPEDQARLGPAVTAALAGRRPPLPGREPSAPRVLHPAVDGVDWVVAFAHETPLGHPPILHAIVVPEEELVGFLGRYALLAGAAVLGVLGLALAGAVRLAGRVARPLQSIAADLERVGTFELAAGEAPPSRIREVATLGDAASRMKRSLRSFGRYVPTPLVRDLLALGEEARLGGSTRRLTLMFSDVKDFTALSEGLAPADLVGVLGAYLELLTAGVASHGGTVDKFMGDGMLAFWGAPHPDSRHAENACAAALALQEALAAARLRGGAAGRPPFLTRIGLHTGDVVVGNIGTPERFAYSVIGDAVNLAARIEALNKRYGTWILASRETVEAAGPGYAWRNLDRTTVAGRAGVVEVHELLGKRGYVAAPPPGPERA